MIVIYKKFRNTRSLYILIGIGVLSLIFYRSGAHAVSSQGAQGPLATEQQKIYGDLIESLSKTKFKFLSNTTFPLELSTLGPNPACLRDLNFDNSDESSSSAHLLDRRVLRKQSQLQLVGKEKESSILRRRDELANGGDTRVLTDPGVLKLSEIKFDKTHHFVIIKYVFLCGLHCNSGAVLVLEKSGSRWIGSSRRPCSFLVNADNPLR